MQVLFLKIFHRLTKALKNKGLRMMVFLQACKVRRRICELRGDGTTKHMKRRAELIELLRSKGETIDVSNLSLRQIEELVKNLEQKAKPTSPIKPPSVNPTSEQPTPKGTPQSPSSVLVIKPGTRVIHKTFGEGNVTRLDETGEYIYVKFPNEGVKRFLYPSIFDNGLMKRV